MSPKITYGPGRLTKFGLATPRYDAIKEGMCPTCHAPLDRQEDCGWCPTCDVGWAIQPGEVRLVVDIIGFEMTTKETQ